jgi:hypothetical protein
MPIELSRYLEMESKKSKYLKKKEIDYKEKRRRELREIAKSSISEQYSDDEIELIMEINDLVMSADGTAEGWGGYDFNPTDYLETSIEIFQLTKKFFTNGN